MKITLRHYYDFGLHREIVGDALLSPDAWDAIRTSAGAFAAPESALELEALARARPDLERRAVAISALLDEQKAGAVASYGVGAGVLEWWLRELRPDRELTATENAPLTVERLRTALSMNVLEHDLSIDAPLDVDLHLFHRIDTEFTNEQWRLIFQRFSSEPILFVASEILRPWSISVNLARRPGLRMRRATHAGFLRSTDAFASLWGKSHDATRIEIADLSGWMLMP